MAPPQIHIYTQITLESSWVPAHPLLWSQSLHFNVKGLPNNQVISYAKQLASQERAALFAFWFRSVSSSSKPCSRKVHESASPQFRPHLAHPDLPYPPRDGSTVRIGGLAVCRSSNRWFSGRTAAAVVMNRAAVPISFATILALKMS